MKSKDDQASEKDKSPENEIRFAKQTGLFTFWTVVNRLTDESGYASGRKPYATYVGGRSYRIKTLSPILLANQQPAVKMPTQYEQLGSFCHSEAAAQRLANSFAYLIQIFGVFVLNFYQDSVLSCLNSISY